MAHCQLTLDSNLQHSQDTGMVALLEIVMNQVLQAQATEQLASDSMSEQKIDEDIEMGSPFNQFNTRVGSITLHVPFIGNGQFFAELFCDINKVYRFLYQSDGWSETLSSKFKVLRKSSKVTVQADTLFVASQDREVLHLTLTGTY